MKSNKKVSTEMVAIQSVIQANKTAKIKRRKHAEKQSS